MSTADLLRFSTRSLRGHRLRSVLSIAGVAIGVASVMLLTSLGEGARRFITGEFAALGSNLIIVVPGKSETEGEAPIFSEAAHDLTLADAEALLRRSPRIARVAPISLGTATAAYGGRMRDVTVVGTTAEFQLIRKLQVAVGRYLPEEEVDRGARVSVIGAKIQRELFAGENPLGEILRIGEERYKVIGVNAPRGMSIGMDLDEVVYIPVSAALRLFDRRSLFRIFVEVRANDQLDAAAADIVSILKERHDGAEDVTIIRQDSVLSSLAKILNVLTAALAAIAAISLAVAGIGIMNVMLVSVTERTAEIGLLRAVGAGRIQILELFLVEASLLSCGGGALGILAGYGLAAVVREIWPALPAYPPTWAVVAGAIVAIGVGLGFGAVPARRAAGLDPKLALGRRRA